MAEFKYVVIGVPDYNDSISRVVLNNTQYLIRFTYNDTFDYWKFSLYDSLKNPIRIGVKIVPELALNLFWGTDKAPEGVFGVFSNLERIGRYDFVNGKAEFVFVVAA